MFVVLGIISTTFVIPDLIRYPALQFIMREMVENDQPLLMHSLLVSGLRIKSAMTVSWCDWRWTRHTNDFFSKSRSKRSENPQLTEHFHSLSSVLARI